MRSTLLILLLAVGSTKAVTSIIKNANIYTVNPEQPSAQAMAIDADGVILKIGTNDEILNEGYEETVTIEMGGSLVLPGFQDVHLHAVEAGIFAKVCPFDPEPIMADIPFYFDDCPNGGEFGDQGWILGTGIDISYIQDEVACGERSPLELLDVEYPNTPVLIIDTLGHGVIANSAAMKAVGYDQLATDPPGGMILRDESTNKLTGIVLENAQQKLRDAAFPPTEANQQVAYDSLLDALRLLAANGVTSVSDAGGFWRQAQTEAWKRAESAGVMTVRASNALYIYPDQTLEEQLPDLLRRYSNESTSLVRFNTAKIYVDGILSLATGALKEPYEAALELITEKELGFEYFGDSATLIDVSKTLASNGFQLNFHVTGDRGASLALDAIEAVSDADGNHRLTHCYLVAEQDIARFPSLNAFADFQVAPSSVSQDYIDFMTGVIGSTRAAQLIPALEVYSKAKDLVVLSSDWDAGILPPLMKIKTVLTRPDGRSFPDVAAVIPLMTRNPAKLLKTNTGSLEIGKLADLVALDMDIFNIPVAMIDDASVVLTMLNGKVVFDPSGIAGKPVGSPAPTTAPTPPSSCSSISVHFGLFSTVCVCLLSMISRS